MTHRVIVPRVLIYYGKRKPDSVGKGQKHTGKVQGTRAQLPTSSPGSHTGRTAFPATSVMCAKCQSGTCVRDSVPGVFAGGMSQRQPLSGTHSNSSLPEGKQVFGINCMVCTNSLNRGSHF